jgi:hypothetical protein
MTGILSKTIAVQFYRINTGFFLVTFLLLFGLLNGKATIDLHHYLMLRISDSYVFATGATALWILYWFKCLTYTIRAIKNPVNGFLYHMQAMGNNHQLLSWISCQVLLLFPLLIYAAITVVTGIGAGHVLLPLLFALLQIVLIGGGALLCVNQINSTWQKPMFTIPQPLNEVKKGFYSYLLFYSLNQRKGTFIGVKLLSLLLLQGMVMANKYEINRESICVLMMFLISAHALLPVYYVRFLEEDLSFIRALPFPAINRFKSYLGTYLIIFLPELLFLLLNGRHSLPIETTLSLYAVAVSQSALYSSILYFRNMLTERYTMIVFAIFFASLLFLAAFNLWLLFAVESVCAVLLFYLLHARYERSLPAT